MNLENMIKTLTKHNENGGVARPGNQQMEKKRKKVEQSKKVANTKKVEKAK